MAKKRVKIKKQKILSKKRTIKRVRHEKKRPQIEAKPAAAEKKGMAQPKIPSGKGGLKELVQQERKKLAQITGSSLIQKKAEIDLKKTAAQKKSIIRKVLVFFLFLAIIDLYVFFIKKVLPLYILLIIAVIILVIIGLYSFFSYKKRRGEEDKNVRAIKSVLQEKKGEYQTELDILYNLLKEKKVLSITEIAEGFNITKEKAEEWGKMLAEHGLIDLHYPPVGEAQLKWKEQESNTK
ncbi:hypothetical protein HY643_03270 [Candidatus Woesearchaeota archaeon]|nr:hypothetical protein [Candidatus Woesearchaeota archaeon]